MARLSIYKLCRTHSRTLDFATYLWVVVYMRWLTIEPPENMDVCSLERWAFRPQPHVNRFIWIESILLRKIQFVTCPNSTLIEQFRRIWSNSWERLISNTSQQQQQLLLALRPYIQQQYLWSQTKPRRAVAFFDVFTSRLTHWLGDWVDYYSYNWLPEHFVAKNSFIPLLQTLSLVLWTPPWDRVVTYSVGQMFQGGNSGHNKT